MIPIGVSWIDKRTILRSCTSNKSIKNRERIIKTILQNIGDHHAFELFTPNVIKLDINARLGRIDNGAKL